jgi:hypothetical protein
MIEYWTLDDAGTPVSCPDLLTWDAWMRSSPLVCVADDRDEGHTGPGEGIRVSTRFLGIDLRLLVFADDAGPPVLWETMVFGGLLDLTRQRYTTQADALAGHQAMCARVRETIPR